MVLDSLSLDLGNYLDFPAKDDPMHPKKLDDDEKNK